MFAFVHDGPLSYPPMTLRYSTYSIFKKRFSSFISKTVVGGFGKAPRWLCWLFIVRQSSIIDYHMRFFRCVKKWYPKLLNEHCMQDCSSSLRLWLPVQFGILNRWGRKGPNEHSMATAKKWPSLITGKLEWARVIFDLELLIRRIKALIIKVRIVLIVVKRLC